MHRHLPGAPASLPAGVLLDAIPVPARMPVLPGFIRLGAAPQETRNSLCPPFRSVDLPSATTGGSPPAGPVPPVPFSDA
jgi:hypothetical protein